MTKQFHVSDSKLDLLIEYDQGDLGITSPMDGATMMDFLVLLDRFIDAASASHLGVQKIAGTSDYAYQFHSKDGRVWNQVLRIVGGNVTMSFNIPDFWKESEFVPHRSVREKVVCMIRDYGVESLQCTCA